MKKRSMEPKKLIPNREHWLNKEKCFALPPRVSISIKCVAKIIWPFGKTPCHHYIFVWFKPWKLVSMSSKRGATGVKLIRKSMQLTSPSGSWPRELKAHESTRKLTINTATRETCLEFILFHLSSLRYGWQRMLAKQHKQTIRTMSTSQFSSYKPYSSRASRQEKSGIY